MPLSPEDELIERSQPGPELICSRCGHDQAFHIIYDDELETFIPEPCDFETKKGLCDCVNFEPMTAEDIAEADNA